MELLASHFSELSRPWKVKLQESLATKSRGLRASNLNDGNEDAFLGSSSDFRRVGLGHVYVVFMATSTFSRFKSSRHPLGNLYAKMAQNQAL